MSKQRIKIVFDAGPLVNGNKTGVGKTTEGLVLALANAYPTQIELVGHYFDFLSRKHAELPSAPNIHYRRTVLVPGKVFNMLRRLGVWIPFELLSKERADFHLFPGFIGWPSLFNTPSAPFIHDITYLDFPEYVNGPARYDLQTIMPRTIRRAAFIITNSQSSKTGIMRAYPTLKKPILVEHLPPVGIVQISTADARKRLQKLGITGEFLLFFGTLEPRKNLVGLLEAYLSLPDHFRSRYGLVIGGGKGWHDAEILTAIERAKASGATIYRTGYVSDEDRAALFMQATLYLMPSHYEGFGMQLLEAMIYQTPMLVSDIAVLHEVADTAAQYCDTDAASIAAGIVSILGNPAEQQRMRHVGKQRLQLFSWDHVAADIYQAIEESVRGPKAS